MSRRICVLGNMGSGKTTFCRRLAKYWDIPLYEEPVVNNPYLDKYYNDPHQFAFQLQTFMLHNRFIQQLEARGVYDCVFDLSMDGNTVFANVMHNNGYMSSEDFKLFNQMYNTYRTLVPQPDIIVYLDCSPKECKRRMSFRGREYEEGVDLEYLEQLRDQYEELYKSYPEGRKVRILCDNLNLKQNERDFQKVIDVIGKFL